MWNPLRDEVTERFASVELFFKATKGNGSPVEQTAKGIAFVHAYAAYEFSVKAIMRTAIGSIMTHGHKYDQLAPTLIPLFLDPDLKSLKDCAKTRVWEVRVKIFERLFSGFRASVPTTTFPDDGSHFRQNQLKTIFDILGIKRLPARRRIHLRIVDEMVDNRNEVAHGMVPAADVGRRYTRTEVSKSINLIKSVCLTMIDAVENQCADTNRHKRSR